MNKYRSRINRAMSCIVKSGAGQYCAVVEEDQAGQWWIYDPDLDKERLVTDQERQELEQIDQLVVIVRVDYAVPAGQQIN